MTLRMKASLKRNCTAVIADAARDLFVGRSLGWILLGGPSGCAAARLPPLSHAGRLQRLSEVADSLRRFSRGLVKLSLLIVLLPLMPTRADDVTARAANPLPEATANSIGVRLVRVPSGKFTMGSPAKEKGRRLDEALRSMSIARDFFIGQFEITRGQFRTFVEATSYKTDAERGIRGGDGYDEAAKKLAGPDKKYSWRFTGYPQTENHPVVNVSWNDALAFCRWLSEREQQIYRLPTEAEWEYACRAGTTSAFCNGDVAETLVEVGNVVDASAHEVFPGRVALKARDGFVFTAPVGSFKPNAWGIHDMHGNVWEWTADDFGPPHEKDKTVRGGDWYHDWSFARSAQRFPIYPGLCRRHAGFRVVRELSPARAQSGVIVPRDASDLRAAAALQQGASEGLSSHLTK